MQPGSPFFWLVKFFLGRIRERVLCHFFVATQAIILEMHQKVLYIIYSPEIEQLEPENHQ